MKHEERVECHLAIDFLARIGEPLSLTRHNAWARKRWM